MLGGLDAFLEAFDARAAGGARLGRVVAGRLAVGAGGEHGGRRQGHHHGQQQQPGVPEKRFEAEHGRVLPMR